MLIVHVYYIAIMSYLIWLCAPCEFAFLARLYKVKVLMLYPWPEHACLCHVHVDFEVQFLHSGPFLSNCKG